MKSIIFMLSLGCLASVAIARPVPQPEAKPNIVCFLIDGLGYADCGFNGGTDIRTPSIDKLAIA